MCPLCVPPPLQHILTQQTHISLWCYLGSWLLLLAMQFPATLPWYPLLWMGPGPSLTLLLTPPTVLSSGIPQLHGAGRLLFSFFFPFTPLTAGHSPSDSQQLALSRAKKPDIDLTHLPLLSPGIIESLVC